MNWCEFFFLLNIILISTVKINSKVIIVAQIFRHGHRYPIKSFSNPNITNPGELSEEGKETSYKKGRQFRQLYKDLFEYNTTSDLINIDNLMKAYCSKKQRTHLSLFFRLKGIFENHPIFNKEIDPPKDSIKNFLKESLNTEFSNDYMFSILDHKGCKKRVEEIFVLNNITNNLSIKAYNITTSYPEIIDPLLEQYEEAADHYLKVFYIADYLVRILENSENSDYQYRLKDVLKDYYKNVVDLTSREPTLVKLFTSQIYATMFKHFQEKINNKDQDNVKLVLFSAHDITLSTILESLKLDFNNFNYDFNDEINFFVYEFADDFYFSIKYNNQELPISFCGGKKLCNYSKLKQFLINSASSEEELNKYCTGELENLIPKNDDKKDEL